MAKAFQCDRCKTLYAGKPKSLLRPPKTFKGDFHTIIEPRTGKDSRDVQICIPCMVQLTEDLLRYLKDISDAA